MKCVCVKQDGTEDAPEDGLSAAVDSSQSAAAAAAAAASVKRSLLVDTSDVSADGIDVKRARNETGGL